MVITQNNSFVECIFLVFSFYSDMVIIDFDLEWNDISTYQINMWISNGKEYQICEWFYHELNK